MDDSYTIRIINLKIMHLYLIFQKIFAVVKLQNVKPPIIMS